MDKDFEPHFLSSTMVFSSNLRVYAATAMQERRSSIREPLERRLLYFSIHQQMCMAMEDLGAHLYAYREKRSGKDYLSALVNYSGSSAYLYELLKGKSQQQIAAEFGFCDKIPNFLERAATMKSGRRGQRGTFTSTSRASRTIKRSEWASAIN